MHRTMQDDAAMDDADHMPRTRGERLKALRVARYPTARAFADAAGVNVTTYRQHENGIRDVPKQWAMTYARLLGATTDYLLFGRKSRPGGGAHLSLDVLGKVGAGAVVDLPDDPAGGQALDTIDINVEGMALLQVMGDSQWPRFMDGEYVSYYTSPMPPDRLINQYCIVQVEGDGRRLIKKLRRGSKPGLYRLESHNAPIEDDVRLLCAWRIGFLVID
jgi:phage repressor protein C with HTH and peptisase S24 domain